MSDRAKAILGFCACVLVAICAVGIIALIAHGVYVIDQQRGQLP